MIMAALVSGVLFDLETILKLVQKQSRRTCYCDAIHTVALCEDVARKTDWHILGLSTIEDCVQYLERPDLFCI